MILLLVVVIASGLSRMLPIAIPRPLVQIACGAAIGLVADIRVEFDSELFFLLLLPPLLFLDGWRIPKDELLKDRSTVLELALGLVAFTVVGMGLFIHWMIPSMPLGVAFALAAVLSPTDPIAVSAIARRVSIPRRMMHILEGESLLNDATGLVCFRFAVAAVATGTFSPVEAAATFVWVAAGGLIVGVGVTVAIMRAKEYIGRRFGEDSGSNILVSLLIPFAAYLTAEETGCSGILAAVGAGVAMSFAEATGQALAATRVRRRAVWDMIQFASNGVVFVLLGEQLPAILPKAQQTVGLTGHSSPLWLAAYVLATAAVITALRFVWASVSLSITWFRTWQRLGIPAPSLARLTVAMACAGPRGAVTLAGVLTLPLVLPSGEPFPARDLAIFIAMGVIITSLLIASIGLPLAMRGLVLPEEPSTDAEDDRARVAAAEAAIARIEEVQHAMAEGRPDADRYVEIASRLMDLYRTRIENRSGDDTARAREDEAIERRMRVAAVQASREAVLRLLIERQIGSAVATRLMQEFDLLEARYMA
ncbi:Na+/H+ antiporter [Rhodoplanes roseus]|uniref:Na+/H+ antiporter n=1 Tax=Rhodoplanes roseus TaxID=29409 RepID=A0A327KYV0_9BRAD|nr:Na+/H+ antiporter [Rhodoplanes roseus]